MFLSQMRKPGLQELKEAPKSLAYLPQHCPPKLQSSSLKQGSVLGFCSVLIWF